MRKAVLVAATIALCGMTMPASEARADDRESHDSELVCYEWSIFPNERFKLNVKKHSPLSEEEEEREFGHPEQIAYSVHGKEVGGCGGDTMLATTGTVIVARPKKDSAGQSGAHLGLEVHASRGFVDAADGDDHASPRDFCRSIEVDCTTSEISPTPDTWHCFSRNEFDVFHGASTLTKVDEKEDPRCSVFEDGAKDDSSTAAAAAGPASGQRR
jgi:hypothetical protein